MQLFEEVKRHKPSVVYIPNVDMWYDTLGEATIRTFTGLIQSLSPTDPVLLLGLMSADVTDKETEVSPGLLRLFGYSRKNLFKLERPDPVARTEFFKPVLDMIRKTPREFPDREGSRKKRKLEVLDLAPVEAPRGPTAAEQREQKKRDRLTLNQLRLFLLPVMEQIKKYKRLRAPAIDEAVISYLFDDQDPKVLSTDLGEQQRQEQQLYRPFEVDQDKHGHPGIREQATGKFYYNLEIVTVEKRLNNGYYKRPQDFAADFKRIAKDAETLGEEERAFKAAELFATVEVDMAHLAQQNPALAAECEGVYRRDLERLNQQIEKAREAQRKGEEVPQIIANVPPPTQSKSSSENSGPIVLGPVLPGVQPIYPITPLKRGGTDQWSTTNGSHPSNHTNGSNVPSRPRENSELLENTQDDLLDQSQHAGHISQLSQSQGAVLTQHSTLTHVPLGSQADAYQNSASTTTSGQKTYHSGSNRTSGHSNGTSSHFPDFSIMAPSGGSQLPDTQPPSVGSQATPPDQPMGPPRPGGRTAPIAALLNDPIEPEDHDMEMSPPQVLLVDHYLINNLHDDMVKNSSGLSLEQLEQVHAALMDVIWKMRGDWNRNKITQEVKNAFNETVKDIEECQVVLDPSQRNQLRETTR